MKKVLIFAIVLSAGSFIACNKTAQNNDTSDSAVPAWLEVDSAEAIRQRTLADFSLDREEMLSQVQARYPEVTDADLDTFVARHYVEAIEVDGELRFHRKSPRNLGLLNPAFNGQNPPRGAKASEKRISYVDSVLNYYRGKNPKGLRHKVQYRFSINVPGNEAIQGDTLRVWMPVPFGSKECSRQTDIAIVSAVPADYTLSDGRSEHNSIYFQTIAPAPGDTAHFEYVGSYITSGQYASEKQILKDLKPYDTESEIYKRYTAVELPHIIRLDSLAHDIVGEETNPFRQSEMVYDYIINRYPLGWGTRIQHHPLYAGICSARRSWRLWPGISSLHFINENARYPGTMGKRMDDPP